MIQTDFLVVGSGIGGLFYAIELASKNPEAKLIVLTKTVPEETNTRYAQGGVAGVWDLSEDSFEKHISDTLEAGDGLCNEEIVEIVVTEGPDRIRDLIAWGTEFDKNPDGTYSLGREGGHSEFRILHYKDITGQEIERALLAKAARYPNIQLYDHYYVVDLITQHHLGYLVTKSTTNIECFGVFAMDQRSNKIEKILASVTMIASGGNGALYRTYTNPTIATGDGVAMVYRAKGKIENMEFIQFHPTALFEAGKKGQAFLITEAVRGDGGILRNHKGEAFMERYDSRKDLAPRDIVARAIDNEMKVNGTENVFLDCTHMDPEKFTHHFPNIHEKCRSIGIDVEKDWIPVSPAAHYSCGGIKVDPYGRTSILNLFAVGECASTGLHGANRLASNSLLEAMVFAKRAADVANMACGDCRIRLEDVKDKIPDWDARGTNEPKELILITQSLKELQQILSDYVGIVRNNVRLQRATRRLDLLHEETEALYRSTTLSPQLCELRNMITTGYLIVKGAQFRQESRGLHFNTDYPELSGLVQNIIL